MSDSLAMLLFGVPFGKPLDDPLLCLFANAFSCVGLLDRPDWKWLVIDADDQTRTGLGRTTKSGPGSNPIRPDLLACAIEDDRIVNVEFSGGRGVGWIDHRIRFGSCPLATSYLVPPGDE